MNRIYMLLFLTFACHAQENTVTTQEQLGPQDIISHGQYWVQQLPDMPDQEITLLANFLYFSFLNSHYEAVTRLALIAVHMQSILLNSNLASGNEQEARNRTSHAIDQLRALKEELLPLRLYASKSWQACLQAIEKSQNDTLKNVIVSLQHYGSVVLTHFAKQDRATIEEFVKRSTTSLTEHLEKLKFYNATLQAILDGKNPYIKEGDNPFIVDMDIALSAADAVLASCNEITLHMANVKHMSVDLLNISKFIMVNFYQLLLASLQEKNKLPMPILFDEKGTLSADSINEELPLTINEKTTINKKHYCA